MTNTEKLALLEEMLEMDEGTMNEEMVLSDMDNWDSMSALSLIVLMDETFGKKLSAAQIKEFKTVKDIIDFMN